MNWNLFLRNIHLWEQAACDDKALNLGSAFKDVEDLGVTEPFGDKLLALGIFAGGGDTYSCCCCLHYQSPCIGLAH